MHKHYTIFVRKTWSPLALIGLFFDLTHIFVNLVNKKTQLSAPMLTAESLQYSFEK